MSVIIPAYNTAGHIGVALDSVFAQSYADFEVLVINDGSPDSEQMELAVAPYLARIVYLRQQPNRGPSAARNLGINQAKGEFLAFLDSDDAWLPHYLAEQMKFLRADPALDMVYCDASLEGDATTAGKTYMQLCPSTGPVTFESLLVSRVQPITSGTVVRRQKVTAAGLFDESIHHSEDHDLWLRVIHAGGKVAYQRQVLLRRIVRADSQGSGATNLLSGEDKTLRKLDRDLDLSPRTRAVLAQRLRTVEAEIAHIEGKEFLQAGEPDKAYIALSRANALVPTSKLGAVLVGLRVAPRLSIFAARFWQRKSR